MIGKLKFKVFSTNWDAWNNKLVPLFAAPFLAVFGVVIGSMLNVHLASSGLGHRLVMVLSVGVTMMAGFAVLALIEENVTVSLGAEK